jgi:aldose 1-epimerase
LPQNDSTKQHAIHGFTPRNRWRVIASKEAEEYAELTGQFHLSRDLPEAIANWPSDFILNVTYRLQHDGLRVQAQVENSGVNSLPFGLGYHPYFHLPGVNEATIDKYILQANVNRLWEAEQNLPTGKQIAIPPDIDFRAARPIGSALLDHVFTVAPAEATHSDGKSELAQLSHRAAMGRLQVHADPAFRELVLFTPPHRQAVAIEPYTCSADAANLAARGIDSGWMVLGNGQRWESVVEYRWNAIEPLMHQLNSFS